MGVREKLNKNPAMICTVAVVVIAAAAGLLMLQGNAGASAGITTAAHYTDDGGKTFFTDDIARVVPYQRDGKTVYRAEVYKGNGEPFVALVLRHSPGAQSEMADYIARKPKDVDGSLRAGIEVRGLQVKRPADPDSAWVYSEDGSGDKLRASLKGKSGEALTLVLP